MEHHTSQVYVLSFPKVFPISLALSANSFLSRCHIRGMRTLSSFMLWHIILPPFYPTGLFILWALLPVLLKPLRSAEKLIALWFPPIPFQPFTLCGCNAFMVYTSLYYFILATHYILTSKSRHLEFIKVLIILFYRRLLHSGYIISFRHLTYSGLLASK